MNTDPVTLNIVASDGKATSSVNLLVKVCQCENNGTCDFETVAEGEDLNENRFAVSIYTPRVSFNIMMH